MQIREIDIREIGEFFFFDDVFGAIVFGAIIGDLTYSAGVLISGDYWNFGNFLKSTIFGAISGAVTFGIGQVFTPAIKAAQLAAGGLFSLHEGVLTFCQAFAHGFAQGTLSLMQGGTFEQAFVAGALGSLAASGWEGLVGKATAQSTVGMIGFGALSGGVGSALSGGNFWQGAIIGGTVAGLNHALHEISNNRTLKEELIKAGYDPDQVAKFTKEEVYGLIQKVKLLSELYGDAYKVVSENNGYSVEKSADYTVWQDGKSVPDHDYVKTNRMSIYLTENNLENGFQSVNSRAFFLSKNSFSSYFNLAKTLGIANIITSNFFNPALLNIKNSSEKTKFLIPMANDWLHKVTFGN